MDLNKNVTSKEGSRIFGGLILIAAGAILLLRNTGFNLPDWLFTWPVIVILAGIYTGFKHNFQNNSWIIIIATGVFFLVSRFIPSLSDGPMFWPLVIIGLGVLFIVRPKRKSRFYPIQNTIANEAENTSGAIVPYPATTIAADSSDYLDIHSVFSGVTRKLVSKSFMGGNIACVFGGAEADLTQADINGEVTIKLELVFGGAKLLVPSHWSIQNKMEGIFHGIDDKRNMSVKMAAGPAKVLVLHGSAVFAGVEIRSY